MTMLHPLTSHFRISPSLLPLPETPVANKASPSSSISSPSFQEHATGLRCYNAFASPLSVNQYRVPAARENDNPLFDASGFGGFPDLHGVGAQSTPEPQAPGVAGIEPLQDAARNLLVALRQLSGATVGASPPTQDSTPAKLADDLEVVVHMLRQREEENGRLQHELTLTQAALKGAEATIRKLRAAPSPRPRAATPPPSSTLALCGRRYSEPAETLPTEHSPGLSPALSPRRSSVCRQLLQSPTASILSGLSVSVATAVAPALGVEGGAPPIELPGYEGLAPDASNEPCASGWQADTPVGAAGATSQVQQPQPLRMGQADQGMSLASAIRATLQCGVETPSVVYGSPLHRRIQRVLALQSGLTPCADAAAQVDGAAAQLAAGEAVAAQWGAAVWAEEQRLQAAKPGQAPFSPLRPLELQLQEQTSGDAPARPGLTPVRGSLSGASVAYTELTSSCQTPYAGLGLADLANFSSSLSPFCPLRERFAVRNALQPSDRLAQDSKHCADVAVAAAQDSQRDEVVEAERDAGSRLAALEQEAAELASLLGLSEAADPLAALRGVEQRTRQAYVAARKAELDLGPTQLDPWARATAAPGDAQGSPIRQDACTASAVHLLVDQCVQTDTEAPALEVPKGQPQAARASVDRRDVGVGMSPAPFMRVSTARHLRKAVATAAAASAATSGVPQDPAAKVHSALARPYPGGGVDCSNDADEPDVRSPARSDQSKASPAAAWRCRSVGASPLRVTTSSPAAKEAGHGLHGRRVEEGGGDVKAPPRRGLFRDTDGEADAMATGAAHAQRCGGWDRAGQGGLGQEAMEGAGSNFASEGEEDDAVETANAAAAIARSILEAASICEPQPGTQYASAATHSGDQVDAAGRTIGAPAARGLPAGGVVAGCRPLVQEIGEDDVVVLRCTPQAARTSGRAGLGPLSAAEPAPRVLFTPGHARGGPAASGLASRMAAAGEGVRRDLKDDGEPATRGPHHQKQHQQRDLALSSISSISMITIDPAPHAGSGDGPRDSGGHERGAAATKVPAARSVTGPRVGGGQKHRRPFLGMLAAACTRGTDAY